MRKRAGAKQPGDHTHGGSTRDLRGGSALRGSAGRAVGSEEESLVREAALFDNSNCMVWFEA